MKHAAWDPALRGPSTSWGCGRGREAPTGPLGCCPVCAQNRSKSSGRGGGYPPAVRGTQFGLRPSEDSMEACAIFTQELAPRLTAPSLRALLRMLMGRKGSGVGVTFHGGWQSDVGSHFHPSRLGPQAFPGAQITTTNLDSNTGKLGSTLS